jgi:hypothetical protein
MFSTAWPMHFGFHVPKREMFQIGAPIEFRLGYRFPALLWPGT